LATFTFDERLPRRITTPITDAAASADLVRVIADAEVITDLAITDAAITDVMVVITDKAITDAGPGITDKRIPDLEMQSSWMLSLDVVTAKVISHHKLQIESSVLRS
jgi:hypothetical protein